MEHQEKLLSRLADFSHQGGGGGGGGELGESVIERKFVTKIFFQ